jgi:pimeloyl-ACP methyl ester carboxylesterase
MTEPPPRSWTRRHPWWTLGIYLLLLGASLIADWRLDEGRRVWGIRYAEDRGGREIMVDTSGLPVRDNPLPYWVIVTGDLKNGMPPVLLMHGSPGAANGFEALAYELNRDGRPVIWLDLPGFASQSEPWSRGRVFETYSSDAYADIMWRVLDAMGVERAHLVGWSNSGAVGLRMIEAQPERVASWTMLAAVGSQEGEGSGDYTFEHLKYTIGKALLVWGAPLYPHFGVIGPMSERRAFLGFFDDTDQRPLEGIMRAMDTPTLILHGRHDFLVPAWAAEAHHAMAPTSRLVMLDASHFIPFLQAEEAGEYMRPFFDRHDTPGVAPETGVIDLAPVPERGATARAVYGFAWWLRGVPWWLSVPGFVLLARWKPLGAIVIAGVLAGTGFIDFGVAGLGLLIGRAWWCARAGVLDRPTTVPAWVRSLGWTFVAFMLAWLLFGRFTLAWTDRVGLIGLIAGMSLTGIALFVLRHAWSWTGWMRLRGAVTRLRRQEYWPQWTHYLPSYIWFVPWCARSGWRASPTAVNPGYARDGGIAEEKKHEILDRMPDPAVLRARLIVSDDDTDRRIRTGVEIIAEDGNLGGYPLIAKPDQGERGRGVKLLRAEHDLRAYLVRHDEPVILQKYHPGPVEVGVLWIRDPASVRDPEHAGLHGRIYAVTVKALPVLEGDGKRTLRRLILAHPRHRAQAGVFLERMKARLDEVPAKGETVSLGNAGNHAQGAMFTDGSHLVTPELEERIDRLARSFVGGFDIGRFDIRCASEEDLKRGVGLGVIELNGVTSEPTNIYDPSWSIFRAQRTLWGYWDRLIDLGIARLETGTGSSLSWPEVVRVIGAWKFGRSRAGRVGG